MRQEEEVELHPAFAWDCPECGIENFCRGISIELSEDEMQEIRDDFEVDDNGFFMAFPVTVCCAGCSREFNSIAYNQ